MHVEIKNYRGVESAVLDIAQVALVCGRNGAGKSSIAQAVSAVLTGNTAPIDGIAKNAAGQLLRDGAKRGYCEVGDENGSARANWPGASYSHEGQTYWASPVACGMQSIVDMKQKDASALLISVIQALPTIDDLKRSAKGVSDAMLEQVWKAIEEDGWDSAYARSKERGARLKGAWEQVTGEKYGAQKAAGWTHARKVPEHDLQNALANANYHLEQAISQVGADQAVMDQHKQAVKDGDAAAAVIDDERIAHDNRVTSAGELLQALESMPKPETAEAYIECPHCKGHLVVVSRSQVRAPTPGIGPDENAARQADIDNAEAAYSAAQQDVRESAEELARLEQLIKRGKASADFVSKARVSEVTDDEIGRLRDAVFDAQQDIAAEKANVEAAKLHKQVVENQIIIDALAPDGVRQEVLARKIGEFNTSLASLAETAGWPSVALNAELEPRLGGRPYILLSESEKFRVRVTLQCAIAERDGSDAVVIDAADILDKQGRNGLLKLIKRTGMRALICMTMNDRADVPDLSKSGIGRSYWLEGAMLE